MEALDFPNNFQIQTTAYCNAKCSFCPYPVTSKELAMGNMEEAVFRRIVDEISQYSVAMVQPFLMADPLMDKRILPRLAYLRQRLPGVRLNITTNGYLLTQKIIDGLVSLNLETIHISSNGIHPDTYRKTMGIDGLTVLRNVNQLHTALREAGARTEVIVTSILLRETREEIFAARDYWKSRGITFYMNPLNDRAGNLPETHFEDMLPFDQEFNRKQLIQYDMSGCPALYFYMGILFNGDVVTCCHDWRRSLVLGNVKEKSLHDIWHDAPYRRLRQLSDEGRLCERELCDKCGNNRFSIDRGSLQDYLHRHANHQERTPEVNLAEMFHHLTHTDQDSLKLGLIH
ncbi:radical SAM protein with 4Fe4S-binding SPASM domain [Lewinella aquimaris]|uniref:Radical SAM protein with 4Fe4S-binding SPASM domain n=1 Tax=Neolewinella aquimaris TaxID=1835722 RepID=A0A840E3Z9_9BACT|nr:radical SAM protein [Neolewinella aquimaris]MBB4079911.1 radical SAM protein with 4Fe4S-binding SPASM domain [Neolewinella aquimaris]